MIKTKTQSPKQLVVITLLSLGTIVCACLSNANIRFMPLYAHNSQLNVGYDECVPEYYQNSSNPGDGEYEKWYEFVLNNKVRHYPHSSTVTEIKYYFK